MKIAIVGHSGAGKSTLAARLGQLYGLPVLHLDRIYWQEGWIMRPREEAALLVQRFLDEHESWVIDGTYSKYSFDRRMAEADRIFYLNLSPAACLWRVLRRSVRYVGQSRPDLAPGCPEKINPNFWWWVLYKGRTAKKKEILQAVCRQYPHKAVELKNQRQIDAALAAAAREAEKTGAAFPQTLF